MYVEVLSIWVTETSQVFNNVKTFNVIISKEYQYVAVYCQLDFCWYSVGFWSFGFLYP